MLILKLKNIARKIEMREKMFIHFIGSTAAFDPREGYIIIWICFGIVGFFNVSLISVLTKKCLVSCISLLFFVVPILFFFIYHILLFWKFSAFNPLPRYVMSCTYLSLLSLLALEHFCFSNTYDVTNSTF